VHKTDKLRTIAQLPYVSLCFIPSYSILASISLPAQTAHLHSFVSLNVFSA